MSADEQGKRGKLKLLREPVPGMVVALCAQSERLYWCPSCRREVAFGYWWKSLFGQQGFLCDPCRNSIHQTTGMTMTITWTPTPR